MFLNRLYHYSIDLVNRERVSGWIYGRFYKKRPIPLTFYLDQTEVGKTIADQYRQDMKEQLLHPDGRCGFNFTFPEDLDFDNYSKLIICRDGSRPLCSIGVESIPDIFTTTLPRVFFIHIPKTAGTSFNSFVRQRYPDGSTATHIESLPPSDYDSLRKEKYYLAGHFRIETFKEYFDPNQFQLYTIIRQPHRHLHSNFNWLRGGAERPDGDSFRSHPDYIQDLGINLGKSDANIRKIMTQLVSNPTDFESELFDNRQTRHFLSHKPQKVTEADLKEAIENLKLFTDIGLTEDYEGFLKRFCKRHGLTYIKQKVPLNRSKYQKLYDIEDPEMQQILDPLIKYDLRLYEAARRQFS